MPRYSERGKLLRELREEVIKREEEAKARAALRELQSDPDSDTGSLEDLMDLQVQAQLADVEAKCYLKPRKKYRDTGKDAFFDRDMEEEDSNDEDSHPWLTDEEFLQKYRIHRESFKDLVNRIRDHPVFRTAKKRPQRKVEYQVLVLLHYLGTSGSGANNPRCRNLFGIGRGTTELYKRRAIKAIRSLANDAIHWPNDAERKEIALRMYAKFDIVNCVGVADGTLFPLTFAPQSMDAPDYHGRKFQWSMTCMIVNDDNRKVRDYLAGWPGSVHDSRVYSSMHQAIHSDEYFSNDRYCLIGDSAFTNSTTMVAAFKAIRNHPLTPQQEAFNTILGRARVSSEHTIGMLKARFPILRSIPLKITDKRNSVRRILRLIQTCVILHNLLIDCNDEIPELWFDEFDDDASDIAQQIGEDHLSAPFHVDDRDDARRQRLFDHYNDMGVLH